LLSKDKNSKISEAFWRGIYAKKPFVPAIT